MLRTTIKHRPPPLPKLIRYWSDFAHHAEPGSLGSQLVSYTYPRGSTLINSRHFYQNTVLMEWVQRDPRPVSLRQLAFFGRRLTRDKLLASANFVQQELPTRLAHRIRDMQVLPFGAVSNPHLCSVYEMYYTAFDQFRRFSKINTLEDNERFCGLLNKLLNDHLTVIPKLVMGAIECSMANSIDSLRLDSFMSSILRSRISRRVIAEQHLALSSAFATPAANTSHADDPSYIGAVFLQCSAKEAVQSCGSRASELIQDLYPNALMPEIIIEGSEDARFPYMQSHLDYILGELLRNSIEATVKNHEGKKSPPPIVVSISNTHESVLIRVSDQGGGIAPEILPYIWSFSKGPQMEHRLDNFKQVPTFAGLLQEVATEEEQLEQKLSHKHGKSSPLHPLSDKERDEMMASLSSLMSRPPHLKLGMGLPLSKVYVEYWDGHIDLHSLEGYGCDVFLRISRLGNQSERLQLDRV
ncbi:uncharacterized protein SAPINGB_P003668 [Magnusiomyces paraingens]|uniref:Protein-serine/threonine kinase n=1 Tax=Magnusiomyces paraingens TaxID=2606893 RepID=A0A5E8BY00_9ASCO|nr:uncharacterized protein SAPINGB_P003668 [Saprochaete ingens]VVT53625.1 unnamed protein product [Saprochaete ingens]